MPDALAPPALRVVRACAAFDLAVTGLLAIPGLASGFFAIVDAIGRAVGAAPLPPFAPIAMLFVHLAGILGVLWALARLVQPTRWLSFADAAGRTVVAAFIVAFVATAGVTPVLLAFVATELGGAVWQVRAWRASADVMRA